jgi:hypothetical protein
MTRIPQLFSYTESRLLLMQSGKVRRLNSASAKRADQTETMPALDFFSVAIERLQIFDNIEENKLGSKHVQTGR